MTGFLNISEAASIAIHVCVALLMDSNGCFLPVRQLAGELGFSRHHTAKIIKKLEQAGFIETERGPAGGARWIARADAVSLHDLYLASGGTPFAGGCLLRKEICDGSKCIFGRMLTEENRRLQRALRQTTLAAVVQSIQAGGGRGAKTVKKKNKPTTKTKEKR